MIRGKGGSNHGTSTKKPGLEKEKAKAYFARIGFNISEKAIEARLKRKAVKRKVTNGN